MGKRGFTLVELLIVLAIVGLLASLIAPYGGKLLEGARSRDELAEARRLLTEISRLSYSISSTTLVNVEGNQIRWQVHGSPARTKVFQYLRFQRQVLVFNVNGIATPGELNLFRGDRAERIDLTLFGAESR